MPRSSHTGLLSHGKHLRMELEADARLGTGYRARPVRHFLTEWRNRLIAVGAAIVHYDPWRSFYEVFGVDPSWAPARMARTVGITVEALNTVMARMGAATAHVDDYMPADKFCECLGRVA